ncbi:MAG TPA: metallophosphoesterase [Bacteroidales bacterium]|nr:metallophosphoesterase [Bacteroidales bacterium]HRZ75756.1 metallophosphoesterase [Bacteroidales bacterium]
MLTRILALILAIGVLDLLVWAYLRRPGDTPVFRKLRRLHFPISVATGLAFVSYLLLRGMPGLDPQAYREWFIFTGLMALIWMPRLVFATFSVLLHLLSLIAGRGRQWKRATAFLALGLAGAMLGAVSWGILIGKSDYIVHYIRLGHPGLPPAWNGLRIAQFSDTHLGSFGHPENVRKGLRMMQSTEADLIVFTGDLINTVAEEAWPYAEDFRSLRAPLGKFAILGNHDIGDYVKGDTIRPPEENRRLLREFFRDAGFVLLEDSAVSLVRDGDTLVVAGVDNWGLPPFRQEGDLARALGFFPGAPTLLLSHDPTHWEAEVKQRPEVLLTLSGHTHGMQMGMRFGNFQWSPASFKYPLWGGLYSENDSYLFVNTGFGFLGFPARIGIRPEISLITLQSKNGQSPQ